MILTVATTDEVAGAGKKSTNKADPGSCKTEFFFSWNINILIENETKNSWKLNDLKMNNISFKKFQMCVSKLIALFWR